MFVDEAQIIVKAGDGGNGCASLHREKFVPRGGPDGGSGGKGGGIVVEADSGLKTLLDFQFRRHYQAERGRHGEGSNKHGRNGPDLILKVPVGTTVSDDSGVLIGELLLDHERLSVVAGGLGGRGNTAFTTPVRKAPMFAEIGEPGRELTLKLELKLLADVGLLGYPNAGKSTLISRISAAKPKIASYPFTTLTPNLGVVQVGDDGTFVVADIPGLIEGAHVGKGLGDRFLKHLERTAVLLHLLDLSGIEREDPIEDYKKIRAELSGYGAGLEARPEIIVGTKIDLPDSLRQLGRVQDYCSERNIDFFPISAVTGAGIKELLYAVYEKVTAVRADRQIPATLPERIYRLNEQSSIEVVKLSSHSWSIKGTKAERAVLMTDFENDEAVDYLRRRLEKLGIDAALKKAGANPGDEVVIGAMAFEFSD